MTDRDLARLARLDISADQFDALDTLWGSHTLSQVLDSPALDLIDYGYGALDTFDALWHDLEAHIAHLYMQYRLTPHQAFLVHSHPTARRNLWGPDHDAERFRRLVDNVVPRDVLVGILLEAATPAEAPALVGYYLRREPDTLPVHERAALRIFAIIESDNYRRGLGCDCPRRGRATFVKP